MSRQHDAATTMLHRRGCQVSSRQDAWHSGQRVWSWFHQTRESCLSWSESFRCLQVGCHGPFTEEWLQFGHSTIKAGLVEFCRDGCPSGTFSRLHR
jgi:hypothetical protein